MAVADFLVDISKALLELVQPLQDALTSVDAFGSLLLRYGWQPPAVANYLPAVQSVFGLSTEVTALAAAVETLAAAPEPSADDVEAAYQAAVALLGTIRGLAGSGPPAGLSSPPDPLGRADFWQTFPLELAEGLVVHYLEHAQPLLFAPLHLLGIVDTQWTPANQAAFRVDYLKTTLNWDRLGTLLSDPGALARQVYGWGGAVDYLTFFNRLARVLRAFDLPVQVSRAHHPLVATYYSTPPAGLRQLWLPVLSAEVPQAGGTTAYLEASLYVLPVPSAPHPSSGAPAGFLVAPYLQGAASTTVALGRSVAVQVKGSLSSDGLTGLEILPDHVGAYLGPGGGAATRYDLGITLSYSPPRPGILLGRPDSHRLQINDGQFGLDLKGDVSRPELALSLGTSKISLVLDFGAGDGFLTQIFGTDPQTFEADGTLSWSSANGLTLSGHAGITLRVPINRTIGAVALDTLLLGADVRDGGASLVVTLTGGVILGPVAATVDQVGVKLALKKSADASSPGLLGSLDLAFGFKPPDGLGLSVDAGPITGGGYLLFDPAHGRYAGVLQLTLPVVTITAIGLLDTRLPGGQPGYSFLILFTADFPPIQLGFGFLLTGLGGLAGINRTVAVQALQDGVRSGSVDNILFPQDPLNNAPQLISDLQTIFPPAAGQYVFGPVLELGWGEPEPIITAELGVLLTLPQPVLIVLLGKVQMVLPSPDVVVIELHFDIAGILDLTNKKLSVDASLRDSHVVNWDLYGDIALRMDFGDQPNFVLSVGGFNPHYQPPANFPSLRRLTLALGTGDNPRLTVDGYVAVTSNTFQVGAHASLSAGVADFSVTGEVGFDALFHFHPFSFLVDVEAGVSVHGPLGFSASVHFDGHLSGPDPYHAWGELVVHCFGTHHLHADISFGQQVVEATAAPPDPWPQLKAEIARTRNWSASLPPGSQRVAALAEIPASGDLVLVDPLGGLTLRERVVPFDHTIDRFGEAPLASPVRFSITAAAAGSLAFAGGALAPVTDQFAAAQFEQLSDAEQLSRPSFEPMNAGVAIASGGLAFGSARGRAYRYATQVVDTPDAPARIAGIYSLSGAAQQAALRNGPAARAPCRNTGLGTYAPPPSQPAAAQLGRGQYVIADKTTLNDMTAILQGAPGGGVPVPDPPEKGAMTRALQSYYAAVPGDRGKYAVVGSWERV
jgi:hypothetical protein